MGQPVGKSESASAKPLPVADAGVSPEISSQVQWVEIPVGMVKESEGQELLRTVFANSAANNLESTREIQKALRLTPQQHEKLADILYHTGLEWATVQATTLRPVEGQEDNWKIGGAGADLKALATKFQGKLKAGLGPEKAALFNLVAYQDLQRFFKGAELQVALQRKDRLRMAIDTATKTGSASFSSSQIPHGSAAAVLANAIDLLQQREPRR
jgi:hypothetical protein